MMVGKGEAVRDMFAAIAPSYDVANRAISAGMDESWRRHAIRQLAPPEGGRILDLCTGTGDLAFHLVREHPALDVTGVDFCEPMLEGARRRAPREGASIRFLSGDVLSLPFGEGEFDGAIMGFSMRNVVDIKATLREARRVLRPGGRFVNLDVSHPSGLGRRLFDLYFQRAVPLIGGAISKEPKAYRYLPSSLVNYPNAETLARMFAECGFEDVAVRKLMFGSIAIHSGVR